MKKYALLFLSLALCVLLLIPQKSAYSKKLSQADSGYVANQILIKFKDVFAQSVNDSVIPEQIFNNQRLRTESLDVERQPRLGIVKVEFDDSLSIDEAIRQAESDPRVEYAEPNFILKPSETVPNDLRFNEMWGLFNQTVSGADISATRAWDLTTGSNNVVVGITDTGVDIQHPDLAGNIWTNVAEIPGNNLDDDNNGFVDDVNGWNFFDNNNRVFDSVTFDAHGTAVAGVIGAVGNNGAGITGVSWNVKLMPLKFISNGSGDTAGAVKAINYAIAQKNKGVNVRAINASWGPTGASCNDSFSKSLKKAINKAGNAGIVFVSSAGNGDCGANRNGDDLDAAPEYPASWGGSLPNALSVAAVDITDTFPTFSNFGHESVSVAAPGVAVLTTVPRGFAGLPEALAYSAQSGTSFSAPHVTGIVALLATREPSLTPEQIKQRIITTAEPTLPLASKIKSSGRANAFNALMNHIPSVPSLGVGGVTLSGKFVFIDGLGFVDSQTVIEVNGVQIGRSRFDSAFTLANGSFTRIAVKLGKAGVAATFPVGTPVNITAFNPNTGARSTAFSFTRRF
ncbi:MAG: S8 family peptidase [Acidobacteriota bacterium]